MQQHQARTCCCMPCSVCTALCLSSSLYSFSISNVRCKVLGFMNMEGSKPLSLAPGWARTCKTKLIKSGLHYDVTAVTLAHAAVTWMA